MNISRLCKQVYVWRMIAILLVVGLLSSSNQITSFAQDENPDQTSENTLLLPNIQGNDNNPASAAETTDTFETLLPSISAEEPLVRAQSSSSTKLMDPFGPGTSTVPAATSTNDEYNYQEVAFVYSGGDVYLTMCSAQACTWAADDAIRMQVTHPNQSMVGPYDYNSYTHDQAPVDVTSLFATGTNTVGVWLVDKEGPVYSLPRALYLVETTDPLPEPGLVEEAIPSGLDNNPNVGYSRDPVDTLTGAFTYAHTDISIAGRGPTPKFVRSYNSSDTRTGILGPAWTHNYNMRLTKPISITDDVIVFDAQGRGNYFTEDSGNYIPPSGINYELVKNGDGTYTLTAKDQTRWVFSETGLLLRIIDRFGNQSLLSYDGNDRLEHVSDPAGRGNLTFAYNGSGLLESVTDWAAREVSFLYDGNGRLFRVLNRELNSTFYYYDGSSSRLTTIEDGKGNYAVTNTYSNGRVATQKDGRGYYTSAQTSFEYVTNIDNSKTTTVTYPATSYDSGWHFQEVHYHDTDGNLTSLVSKPTASTNEWITETYGFNGNGFRTSVTDGRGNTTHFCYDVDYSGSSISGSYGNLTRVIGPQPTGGANRPVTLFTYDGNNNLIQEVAPKGVPSGTTVTCSTNLSSIDSDFATNYVYDSGTSTFLEAVTRSYTDPDLGAVVVTTTYEYDDDANPGLVSRTVPPRGNVGSPNLDYATTYEYGESGSQAGMLIEVTAPMTTVTTYEYDSVGRMIEMVDPKGNAPGATAADHTWEYTYDDEDRLLTQSAPPPVAMGDPLVTEYRYDEAGNINYKFDANGQITAYDYDERDSVYKVIQSPDAWTDPENWPPGEQIETRYEYDHLGNLTRVKRARNDMDDERVTDYTFDGLGRVRTESNYPNWPSTSPTYVITHTYDTNSNLASRIDALGQSIEYDYDALNRLVVIDYTDPVTNTTDVAFEYDANSNRTRMDNSIADVLYEYDELNRMLSVETYVGGLVSVTNTVEYRYDRHGNKVTLIYPDATEVDYAYDAADRMTTVTDWDSRITAYDYFVDGTVDSVTHFNDVVTEYSYDNANRLTQIWHKYGSDTFTRYTYTLDDVGNRTSVLEVGLDGNEAEPLDSDRNTTIDYEYDAMYRLVTEDIDAHSFLDDKIIEYEYDPVGNRIYQSIDTWSGTDEIDFTYDKMDRIEEADGDYNELYSFDAKGNLTYRATSVFDPIWYLFDRENRIVGFKDDVVDTYYYYPDGSGNRMFITFWNGFSTTLINSYVYDVNRGLAVMLQDIDNKYVYGLGTSPLYADIDSSPYPPYSYHTDGTGSVRFTTDDRNPPRARDGRDYDAFGQETGSSLSSNEQPFQYAGEQKDGDYWNMPESGYYYLRARYYDPITGRFASRDSYAGNLENPLSLNRYTYVENNPVNYVDPSGEVLQYVAGVIAVGEFLYLAFFENAKELSDEEILGETEAEWRSKVVANTVTFGLGEVTSDVSKPIIAKLVHPAYPRVGRKPHFPNKAWWVGVRQRIRFGQLVFEGGVLDPTLNYSTDWIYNYLQMGDTKK